jgi:hypothetical protein
MLQLQTRGNILGSTPMLVNSTGKSSNFGFDFNELASKAAGNFLGIG